MARQDSTRRSRASRHRWLGVSDARSRLCMVRSGRGDRGCESPYRAEPAALFDGIGLKQAVPPPEPRPATPSARQVMSNCPQCSASLVVLRIIPGKAGAEYWTMRCTKCGGIHLDIVKADSPAAAVAESSDLIA